MGDSAKFLYPGQKGGIFWPFKNHKIQHSTRSLFNFLIPERLGFITSTWRA